jgi:hypothetical protein
MIYETQTSLEGERKFINRLPVLPHRKLLHRKEETIENRKMHTSKQLADDDLVMSGFSKLLPSDGVLK